jgi:hypothetical protein
MVDRSDRRSGADAITVAREDSPPPRERRRWLPLAVAVAAVVLFAAIAGSLGGDDGAEETTTTTTAPDLAGGGAAEDSTTTTTSTLPATLEERLPGFDGIVAMAVRSDSGGTSILWGSTERQARDHPLTATPDEASFDASGSWVAYRAFTDANPTLFVGLRTGTQRAESTAVTSAVWHPTVERVLAWVTRLPNDGRTVLLLGRVNARTGVLEVAGELTDLPEGTRLRAWGEWGLAVETMVDRIPVLTILATDGTPLAAAPVSLRGATADGLLLVESRLSTLATQIGALDDLGVILPGDALVLDIPADGAYVTDATLVPLQPDQVYPTAGGLALHPLGERVAYVENRGTFTAVTSYGLLSRRVPRITSIDRPARLIAYSGDGRYLMLQEVHADGGPGSVFLLDWNSGAWADLDTIDAEVVAAEMQPALAPGTTSTTTPPVEDASQSPEDAARDGVAPELAALPLDLRAEQLVRVEGGTGDFAVGHRGYSWVLARASQELQGLGDYGEILLLDQDDAIVKAYPMPGAIPTWILIDDSAVWSGRTGDGAVPDSTVVRIDRRSLEAEVLVVPAAFEGGTDWPAGWRVATPDRAADYARIVGFEPRVQGTPVDGSWVGPVVVDHPALLAWFDEVVSTP